MQVRIRGGELTLALSEETAATVSQTVVADATLATRGRQSSRQLRVLTPCGESVYRMSLWLMIPGQHAIAGMIQESAP